MDPPGCTPALAPEPPSTLVKPALDQLDQTITALRFDRWKKGSIRDEASQDSDSISNNLHRSLPPLLLAADAAPTANSKLVPAFQNVDAVYDVLLRVYSGRSAAEILDTPPRFIEAIGLAQHLSPTRSNGLAAMLKRIKDEARARV